MSKKEVPKANQSLVSDEQIISLLFAISAVAKDLALKLIKRTAYKEKQNA